MKTVILQGALPCETEALIAAVGAEESLELGGFRFWVGAYRGLRTVVSETMVGEISAAIATAVAIQRFSPALIVNQGTAGAHDDALRVGDTVIADSVRYLSPFSTEPNADADPLNPWKTAGYRTFSGECAPLLPSPELVERLRTVRFSEGRVAFGTVGSGDLWTREREDIRRYRAQLSTLCEEMEAAGACMTAGRLGVPFLALRVISNNELTGEPFDPRSGLLSQENTLRVLDHLLQEGSLS